MCGSQLLGAAPPLPPAVPLQVSQSLSPGPLTCPFAESWLHLLSSGFHNSAANLVSSGQSRFNPVHVPEQVRAPGVTQDKDILPHTYLL